MIKQKGFTLVELIFSLVIVSILTLYAVDGMRVYVHNEKIRSAAVQLLQAFKIAQVEAIKRNGQVTLSLTDNTWETTFTSISGVETIVDSGTASVENMEMVASEDSINYSSNGFLSPLNTVMNININSTQYDCKIDGGEAACLQITVSPGGNARICNPTNTGDNAC